MMNSDLINVYLVKTNGQHRNLNLNIDLDSLEFYVFKKLTIGNFKAERGGSLTLVNTNTYCVNREKEFDNKNSLHLQIINDLINK